MDYKKMLEDVRKSLPEAVFLKERFEIPKALGHIQGNRTIITNFLQIASTLRRDVSHLLKYILKELATPGNLSKSALIMGRKVPASMINEKIVQYSNYFVICKTCKKHTAHKETEKLD